MLKVAYQRATSINEALSLLNEKGLVSRPLAGGTDLMLALRLGAIQCDRVVDITRIPELHEIRQENQQIRIGATVTFNEAFSHPLLRQKLPVLVQACSQVGAEQIRNMGTLGGNVANAAACADSLPALVCLDAASVIFTPDGHQKIPVCDLVTGPNHTLIPAGGLLAYFDIPLPNPDCHSVFFKLGRRNAMAISRLSLAAMGRLDGQGKIIEARLVAGAAAPLTRRLSSVETFLIGRKPDPEILQNAAHMVSDQITQITGRRWSSEYKIPALEAICFKTLTQLFINSPKSLEQTWS